MPTASEIHVTRGALGSLSFTGKTGSTARVFWTPTAFYFHDESDWGEVRHLNNGLKSGTTSSSDTAQTIIDKGLL